MITKLHHKFFKRSFYARCYGARWKDIIRMYIKEIGMKRSICNTMHNRLTKGERILFWTIAAWGIFIACIGIQFAISIH